MLTKLTIRNFKRFENVTIDLSDPVVFIGPNNSGKTSAMQALALWEIGIKRWNEKHPGKTKIPAKQQGVAINRRDLFAIPNPSASLLWRNCRTRNIFRESGRQQTNNVRIEIIVEGVTKGRKWESGLEFDYANSESFYCRPLRTTEHDVQERMPVPEEAKFVNIAFLPPLSGLAANETKLELGAVNVRIGEGRTADVLRNLCWQISDESNEQWADLALEIKKLFGVDLDIPKYTRERGEITMSYRESGCEFDLSSSGRGLQQTLLLLAYMRVNHGAVILLDEPDAHLEILRQRRIYRLLCEKASELGAQVIAASHSEVILNEAADKDLVIAFVGEPHTIGASRHSQLRKALAEISWDDYYQAEQMGWVLYLEGSTDLAILQAFAKRFRNENAMTVLEQPFVHYIRNEPSVAARHFFGLREAFPNLKGVALFDRLDKTSDENPHLNYLFWKKREIENYLCTFSALKGFVEDSVNEDWSGLPIFEDNLRQGQLQECIKVLDESIAKVSEALEVMGSPPAWGDDIKASDDFLVPLFRAYYNALELPNLMAKSNFHKLVEFIPENELDREVDEKLDAIASVAETGLVH